MRESRRSPSIPPSTTTWPTWMFCLPYSRAMLCARLRSAAFADAKERRRLVAAGVVDRDRERRQLLGFRDKASGVIGVGSVSNDEGGLGADLLEFLRHRL